MAARGLRANLRVPNPATCEVLGEVADGGTADVKAAIDAAEAAFPAWSARTAYERSEVLYEAYRLMLERRRSWPS